MAQRGRRKGKRLTNLAQRGKAIEPRLATSRRSTLNDDIDDGGEYIIKRNRWYIDMGIFDVDIIPDRVGVMIKIDPAMVFTVDFFISKNSVVHHRADSWGFLHGLDEEFG